MEDFEMTPEDQAVIDENTKSMEKVHAAMPESMTREQVVLMLGNIATSFAETPAEAITMLGLAAGVVMQQPEDFWQQG